MPRCQAPSADQLCHHKMDLTQVCWFVEWIRWGRKRTAACEADWYVFNRRASVQHQQTCV